MYRHLGWFLIYTVTTATVACGGGSGKSETRAPTGAGKVKKGGGDGAATADPHAAYGELEVGVDYASWKKASTEPFLSPTHGKRFVEVYVNDLGWDAYMSSDAEIPVGTVVVKTSWETTSEGDRTDVAGPVFVMEKRQAGFDPENDDWWYALHWAEVPERLRSRWGEQVYWRSPSKKVNYCFGCHNSYERQLGTVPADKRARSP